MPFKGFHHSDETRKRISESMSGDKNPFYGRHHSEESCKKNSESHLGKCVGNRNPFYGKRHSDEARKKNSDAHKGKIFSEEHRRKIGIASKSTWSNPEIRKKISDAHVGIKNHNYGKHHSLETRQKISEARKGKYTGEKNHNYGNHRLKGENHPFYGKKHYPETIKRMSESHKGKKPSEETRIKMSEKHKGENLSEETRRKMSEARKGKHRSIESIRKTSEANRGRIYSDETLQKMSQSLRGRTLTEQQRIKQSQGLKEYYKTHPNPALGKKGELSSFYGKKHSAENKKKMSDRMKGKYALDKHPLWLGGKSFEPYTREWHRRELQNMIRDRDGHKCCVCSTPENGRKHTVHHIDYDKKNCHPINLITLCLPCHTKTNGNRNYWTNYFQSIMGHVAINMDSNIGSHVDNVDLQMN